MRLIEKIDQERYSNFALLCLRFRQSLTNVENLERAKVLFDQVTPLETFVLVDEVVKTVGDIDSAKLIIQRLLNAFFCQPQPRQAPL